MTRSLASALLLTLGVACSRDAQAELPRADHELVPKPGQVETAVFAAGCFWCVEAVFEALEGVVDVTSGYAGDERSLAKYDLVSSGRTRHAEAVKITYDHRIGYGRLLEVLFATHDPTTPNRQGPDHGPQYRSAIFFRTEAERAAAAAYVAKLEKAKVFEGPIVTELSPLAEFFPAEAYHQDFVTRHPDHPYVVRWSRPKLAKLKEKFPALLKPPQR